MKKKLSTGRKIISAILAVMMLLTLSSVPSLAATAPTPDNGDIVINSANSGDKFSAYKIINITYDSAGNTLAYSWTNAVQAILTAKSDTTTPQQFAALSKDARQEFLAVITDYLVNGGTIGETTITAATAAATNVTVGADGKATFTSMPWGEYLIVPTLTTSVYEIMVGAVQPVGNGTAWTVTQGDELTVKKTDAPTIDKAASTNNTGSWTEITYSISASVPKYDGTVVDNTFIMGDTADAALSYQGSMKIYGVKTGQDDTLLTLTDVTNAAGTTTPETGATAYTFTLNFDYDSISTYESIKVTYVAKITTAAELGADSTNLSNTGSLTYSNYPYVQNSHKTITDTEDVKTYGIKVFKYDTASATGTYAEVTGNADVKPLPNAVFDVYRPVEAGETGVSVTGIDGNVVKVTTITSGADGYATVIDIKAGTYYLVETTAPSGYNKINDPITVTFAAGAVDAEGYYDQLISNSNGINLPQTGGIGTLIFTIAGISLMAAAVIILVVLKKKKANSSVSK